MIRRALIGALAVVLFSAFSVFTADTAAAAPETVTVVKHDLVETFVNFVPTVCDNGDGPPYTITQTSTFVQHTTIYGARVHQAFMQNGTFVAVPLDDPSLPSYSAHFSYSASYNEKWQNGPVVNFTDTFTARGTGSDGSTFRIHANSHANLEPEGSIKQFFHCQ